MEMKIYERWLQALLSSAPRSRVLARLASLAQIGELARRLIFVSRTVKTRKFRLLYFQNETCYETGNLYKDLFFVYLHSSVNKNS